MDPLFINGITELYNDRDTARKIFLSKVVCMDDPMSKSKRTS